MKIYEAIAHALQEESVDTIFGLMGDGNLRLLTYWSDELEQRSGVRLEDPHRPFADDIAFPCACGEPATRVTGLVQPWFEAGAVPFAECHEPFAGDRTLDELYPLDLVCARRASLLPAHGVGHSPVTTHAASKGERR